MASVLVDRDYDLAVLGGVSIEDDISSAYFARETSIGVPVVSARLINDRIVDAAMVDRESSGVLMLVGDRISTPSITKDEVYP
jgi:hypothetical protein